MVKLNDDMKKEMAKMKLFMFATASKKGVPNVVPVGMLMLHDDDTVWIVDNFFGKTAANIAENPVGSFVIWNPDCTDSYQVKGKLTVENSGADYQKAVEFAHSKKKELPAKNLVKMKVTDVFFVTPGPKAGKKAL
jgi:predicted pyridoxine 5'-phosphate oxidase superfamily flavin-nucleotide-binding protein